MFFSSFLVFQKDFFFFFPQGQHWRYVWEKLRLFIYFEMVTILPGGGRWGVLPTFGGIQYLHCVPKEWSNHQVIIYSVIGMVEEHSQTFKIYYWSHFVEKNSSLTGIEKDKGKKKREKVFNKNIINNHESKAESWNVLFFINI